MDHGWSWVRSPIGSGSSFLAGWVVEWDAWWAANPTLSVPSFNSKDWAQGLIRGKEQGLASWEGDPRAQVSSLLLISCYPGQSLPLPISLWLWKVQEEVLRMLVRWALLLKDGFFFSPLFFRAQFEAYWSFQAGGQTDLQLLDAIATAMWDLSGICDLYHSSALCQILNSLIGAKDWTCILTDPS